MVNAALVGLGDYSNQIIDAIKGSTRIRIQSVYSRTRSKRDTYAERLGCVSANSYEEILNDHNVDVVLLVTPNSQHYAQIIDAFKHDKYIFVEKPVTSTLIEALAIRKFAKDNQVFISVGHNSRRRDEITHIRQLINQGYIGDIVTIEANISSARGLKTFPGEWRYSRDECGSGPIIQLAVHHYDTLQSLFGSIVEIAGYQNSLHIKTETTASSVSIVQFASGLIGTINSSYVIPSIYRISIYGTKGHLMYDKYAGLHHFDGEQYTYLGFKDYQHNIKQSILNECEELADWIEKGIRPLIGIDDAIRAIAVVEACELSAKLNSSIKVAQLIQEKEKELDQSGWYQPHR